MIRLTVLEGPDRGLIFETEEGSVSLSKAASNQLVLTDRYVSRYHGEVLWDGKHLVFRDLHSSNGSAVRRGAKTIAVGPDQNFVVDLQPGDSILLGDLDRPTVVSIDWPSSSGPEDAARLPEEPAVEVRDRTELSSWKTLESSIPSDVRAVTGLYRLTRMLTEVKEGEDARSLFRILADTLFETFPAATHVMVAGLCPSGESGAEEIAVRFCATRLGGDEQTRTSEGAIPFSRSLIRRALADQSGFLFSAASGGSARSESVMEARILSGMIVPYRTDEGESILQIHNRSGGEGFTRRDLEILTVFSVYAGQIQNLHSRIWDLAE